MRRVAKKETAALTPRQQEVFEEARKGHSNKVIARTLNISEVTVKKHVSAVLEKTGYHSRWQLIAEERTRIVAWLRSNAMGQRWCELADAIERGEHMT